MSSEHPFQASSACHGKMTGLAELERIKSVIRASMQANLRSLGFFAIALLTAGLVIIYCVRSVVALIQERNRLKSPGGGGGGTAAEAFAGDPDNALYRSGSASAFDDAPPTNEADAIAASVKRVAALYAPYNQAMRAMAENRDAPPDDLMGAAALSRTDDDFIYPRRDVKRLVFRPGAGAQRVYTRFSDGDVAFRNPVYATT